MAEAYDITPAFIRVVKEQLGAPEEAVRPEASFVEDLGADSLDLVELGQAFEDEFSLSIPEEECVKLRTVQDAVTYIRAHKGA